ncbi:TetR/AcrR family transcriptional regulator [Streptomyces yaizuensis]|uniref:TetR/AcrR family transcriptional regulator n=1 Tax=Streptomyces yaizuensis TaxID=2989713 RepID=A0ABQ5NRN9_9ACTN|nr:TetR/AcrR family transcriptional regulator [Streptomyces sp. YSPA8]GLF92828.1 TetR/AcrR family transcriptional regulator [Streptomyces sp. YSPA8]
MRRNRAEQREHNRRALLDSARHLLATQGVNVPVDSIAAAADLTTGAVYSIFGSKRDLILAVIEEGVHEHIKDIDRLGQSDSGLPALLDLYARQVADGIDDDFHEEARLEVLLVLLCLDDEFFRRQSLRLQHLQRDALISLFTGRPVSDGSDGPSQRRVSGDEAALIASSLLALSSGFLLRGIPGDHMDLDSMVLACANLVHLIGDGPTGHGPTTVAER